MPRIYGRFEKHMYNMGRYNRRIAFDESLEQDLLFCLEQRITSLSSTLARNTCLVHVPDQHAWVLGSGTPSIRVSEDCRKISKSSFFFNRVSEFPSIQCQYPSTTTGSADTRVTFNHPSTRPGIHKEEDTYPSNQI